MALSARHLASAAGLACLAIAVAKLPPPPDPVQTRFALPRETAPSWRRVLTLQRELNVARRQLGEVSRHAGRVGTLAAAARPGRPPVLVSDVAFPPAVRRAIEERLRIVWQRLGPPSPEVGVVVSLSRYGRLTHILPAATDGRACVIEIPIGWRVRWLPVSDDVESMASEIDDWLMSAIGPCGFYFAFGRPGPLVEEWLLSRSFDVGWTNWTTPDPAPLPQDEALLRHLMPLRWGGDDLYASLDAVACNAGDLARCRTALFGPRLQQLRSERHMPSGIVTRWWFPRSLYDAERYLADLTRAIGPERFATFWRSPLPVPEAFAHAAGGADPEPTIEAWTARWQRERMGQLRVGPAVRFPSVLLGLLAAGICVGAVALWAGRRQVE